jgi:hypothetical protein
MQNSFFRSGAGCGATSNEWRCVSNAGLIVRSFQIVVVLVVALVIERFSGVFEDDYDDDRKSAPSIRPMRLKEHN